MTEEVQGPAGAPSMLLTVHRTERAGVVVVGLAGELDASTADQAAAALTEATEHGTAIVVDMTGLRFFSSAGLNLLLQLRKDLAGKPIDVRLAGDQRAVLLPMELTGLTGLFPIHGSVEEALRAMGR